MPEFCNIDSYQITLSGVTTIDASSRGGSSFILKNPAGNSSMYIGPATNLAGNALSTTTGFLLEAGASVSFDLTAKSNWTAAEKLSVKGTDGNILHVLVLKP